MNNRLLLQLQVFCEQMRVQVTCQESELKKQHAGGPHSRGAAVPGQDETRDDGLNLKNQKRAGENGDCEREHTSFPGKAERLKTGRTLS